MGFRVYGTEEEGIIPSEYDAQKKEGGVLSPLQFSFRIPSGHGNCIIAVDGKRVDPVELDKKTLIYPSFKLRFDGVWMGSEADPQPKFSAYRFFSTHAYFDGPLDKAHGGTMPVIEVSLEPFEIVKGKISYRRSAKEHFDEATEQSLLDSGYMFRVDANYVYYTNSVACYYGLPPVAAALGWPKFSLRPLFCGWQDKVAKAGVMEAVRR